jgi:hypothetical protein
MAVSVGVSSRYSRTLTGHCPKEVKERKSVIPEPYWQDCNSEDRAGCQTTRYSSTTAVVSSASR